VILRSKEEITTFLSEHRTSFKTPQVYLGKEANTHRKEWKENGQLHILLAWPIRYEDSRGNQTLPLLYQMLNDMDDVLCDRAYFPNSESDYKLFFDYNIPIFGLETKRCMGEYDIIMTSLSFLPPWVNFPLMLQMSGIPSSWEDRLKSDELYPIIMVGGSAIYGNFSIAYPVADVLYFGDAEPGLMNVLSYLTMDEKRGRALEGMQEELDFVMVPYFYDPIYKGDEFVTWRPVSDKFPKKLRTIKQKDLNLAPALIRPPVSYTDTTMGLGEVEVSRGCRGSCLYCGIGWKYRPYRERSRETMVQALLENKRQTGATALCPIATEFAYYSEKRGLFNDLIEHSAVVDPLSMRVDAFAKDEQLMRALSDSGMNQLAIGVEAPSQRLRNRLMKGIGEEEIFTACQIAIDSGKYRRIKFFMISNIDETWEDYEELFAFIQRVVDEIGHVKSSIRVKVSWTPLFVEPCTPLQWKKPTIEQRQPWKQIANRLDDLNPKDGKGKVIKKIVHYPPGGGGKHEENFLWLMQGMHLGDTRFANAVLHMTLHLRRPYYVSFAKSMKNELTKQLEKHGIGWNTILRERASNETFPWDIVNRGVSKITLRRLYDKYASGELDNESKTVPPAVDTVTMNMNRSDEREAKYWYLAEYFTHHAIIPNTYWEAVIHRSAYMKGFPIAVKSLHFFSDRANRNWFSGYDYFFIGTWAKVSDSEQIRELSGGIDDFSIIKAIPVVRDSRQKKVSFKDFYSCYDVSTDMRYEEFEANYSEFSAKEEVHVLVPETRYFSGERKKKVDIKSGNLYRDIQYIMEGDFVSIRVSLNEKLGIRYFLSGLLANKSWKKIQSYSVVKSGLYLFNKRYQVLTELFE
jgi:radical SAM superfamily enzyme YgiQ (UPF0313 family)